MALVAFLLVLIPESVILCNNPVYVSHFHVAEHHPYQLQISSSKGRISFEAASQSSIWKEISLDEHPIW